VSCLQAAKLVYQPPSVPVSPPAREPAYEAPMRDAPPVREIPSEAAPIREPISAQSYHPGLMVLQRESIHAPVSFSSPGSAPNPVPSVGVPRTKFDNPAAPAAPLIASSHVTDLPAVSLVMATPTSAAPAVVSAVTSPAHLSTFRSPVSGSAAATVPVVRRRTSDKSHLPIAVGQSTHRHVMLLLRELHGNGDDGNIAVTADFRRYWNRPLR